MQQIETLDALRRARAQLGGLGLVPTMGYLHEGHMDLVRRARAENEAVAVSIFVNPTQFGPNEDFERYPRDMERDLALLRREGVDLVWTPPVSEVYPSGASTFVTVEGLTERLEGAMRPGHFRGVATVVCKLFVATAPQRAYFGQKDAQQVLVIRQMVRDLLLPLDLVVCPTVREPDGLAMSSRNVYLGPAERAAAPALYAGLRAAAELYRAGQRNAETLREAVRTTVAREPLLRLEYVSLADPATLEELETVAGRGLISLAARLGKTRLIDNLVIGPDGTTEGLL
ncbi:MAG: pantoate--beta-alanine ligase [Roseiflexaceae bacterium]